MALAPSYRSLNMTQFTCIHITITIQVCSTIITAWNHAQHQSISVSLEDMSSGLGYVSKFFKVRHSIIKCLVVLRKPLSILYH